MYQLVHTSVKSLLFAGLAVIAIATHAADPQQALIENGEYIARIGGCASCHTLTKDKPLAGGYAVRTPFGSIHAPNITPDVATGIGSWSFDDFWQAMHQGKGENGKLLYPAFPYTSYTKMRREDAIALYTYLQSLPAIRQDNREPNFDFPYSMRSALYVWRALYFKEGEYQDNPEHSAQWNRGAYLVQGVGHCDECHTTRNALGAVDQKHPLVGGLIPAQDWYAPNLSMQKGGDLEGWTQDDMIALLKTGLSRKGGALGPMADVVRNSTQYMTDGDLKAVAVYLASLPAPALNKKTAEIIKAADYKTGQALFAENCASCHGEQGQGVAGIYPALAANPTVVEPTGVNTMRSVLLGGFTVTTQSNSEPYSMPPFADALDNAQIAAVINYIRQSWGNNATAITPDAVRAMRHKPIH